MRPGIITVNEKGISMYITAEEKLMYEVMKAIYDSGIPISFKGSMVLRACLIEAGYIEDTRHTVDIDANWNTNTLPSAEQMTESLQRAIRESGIDLSVNIFRMYGEGRSAGFELTDNASGEVLFTMDVDVNRPVPPTRIYEVEGLQFRGVSPIQIIADKTAAISTDTVFRRIKDIVDLYYLSQVFLFERTAVLETLENSGRQIGDFSGFLKGTEKLKHAYEKFRFRGGADKPSFDDVYCTVKAFIKALLPRERNRGFER